MKNDKRIILKNALKVKGFKYVLLILTGVLHSLFSVAIALSIKNLLNSSQDELLNNVILLVSLVLLSFLSGVFNSLLLSNLATIGDCNLKKFVFYKYFGGKYQEIDKFSSADVITRLDGDITKISSVSVALLPSLISNVVHAVAIVVALFVLAPTFTIIMLGLGILLFGITYFIRKISYKLYKGTRKAITEFNSHVIESKSNSLFVKADGGENCVEEKNNKNVLNFKKYALKQRYFNTTVSEFTSLTFTLFNIFTILWCVFLIFNDVNGLSIGLLVAMIQLVMQIKTPIVNMSSYITVYQETLVSLDRVGELILTENKGGKVLNANEFESLKIENLSFRYGDKEVLKDVNLTINKGDKIVIKGLSGVGKSTLLKILLGVLNQDGGKVKAVYGGCEYDVCSLINTFSLVPQGNMLFSGTIKENLTFNNPEVLDSDIDKVLEITCLKDFISSLDKGINATLSENSTTISEGQAQRIAIARALLKKAPVVIFDEATSSLDEKTENQIIQNLQKIENLTLIAVSHKDGLSKICNKRFEIKSGKLISLN